VRVISVRQPWAWAIVQGHKPVENRDWATHYRGPLLIHASKSASKRYVADQSAAIAGQFGLAVPAFDDLPMGGIVGMVNLVDCVTAHPSQWFIDGSHGWVLEEAKALPFYACKGALGFFNVPAAAVGLEAVIDA
jgi:hypothetical protein